MNSAKPFPIVAIGAAAGGSQALRRFLSALPEEFDFVLVFMPHFSPEEQGLFLSGLLREKTGKLEIVEVSDGLELRPGRLYVCRPGHETSIERGVFHTFSREDDHSHLPFDEFLMSLAEDAGERTIAVVFSGAGMDGARGTQTVRAVGGTVFVQDPATAEHGDMPVAAMNAGPTDGVLPPEEIAREIIKLHDSGMDVTSPDHIVSREELDVFFDLLYERTGYRFNHYKQSVVGRRIRRRMYLHGVSSTAEYRQMLATKESEAGLLASDLMIGVTAFFRDHLAWRALHLDVTRKLVVEEDESPIRVWCAACATGEEAYSIAMLLEHESELAPRKREIQIFATDVNDQALEKARDGVYPAAISADVPAEYMRKYFSEPRDGSVTISKEIRQRVVFAKQDVLSDPPFSRMDLIICRNLLIYLEPDAQAKCFALFHYALKKGGYLFLGGAESPGRGNDLFTPLPHKKCRVFRKAEAPVSLKTPLAVPYAAERSYIGMQTSPENRRTAMQVIHEALLEEFAPTAVAINQDYSIVYHSGPTHRYLRHPRGVTTQSLLELLPEAARNRIRGALFRAASEHKAFSIAATIAADDGRKRHVTIRVSKLRENLFLILFKEKSGRMQEQVPEATAVDNPAVHQLEYELSATRDELQHHIEQLRSLNEELQSSNEEFQAANEELETSREELQSLNEELTTVNSQLQTKIEEEEETNNDLNNFIQSTAIPTMFLDERLKVKRFTPAMAKLIKLIPGDVGRPIADMSRGHLGPDLLTDAQAVLDDLSPVRKEFTVNASWYARTILPYRTSDNRIEGVVVTYTDITELKAAEERSKHLASFPLLNPNPVIEIDASGTIVFVNPAAEKVLESCGMGRDSAKVFLPSDFDAIIKTWDRTTESTVYRDVTVKERIFNEAIQLVPLVRGARIYARDITERRMAEEALQISEQRVRLKLESILSPEGDLGDLELSDIIDIQAIQSLMDDFYELLQIPMAVIDLKGTVLVGEGWQDICTKFHRVHPETCRHCIESDLLLSAGILQGQSRLYKCKNNMWDIATPLIIGGKHMGNVFSGQFFFEGESIDYGVFRAQARKYGFDEEDYIAALDAVPRLSRKLIDRAMSFFAKLAHTLSQLSYSNVKLARSLSQGEALTASLRRSEERLNMTQAMAHVGGWELDLVNDRLSWSDEVYRIFGLKPQEFGATYEAFLDAIHPDDRTSVDAAYSASVAEGKDAYEIEHRIVRKHTGEVRIVREKCEHLRGPDGRITRSLGMVHDITELKQREQRIAALSRLYEMLSRVNEAIVRVHDERSLYSEVCRTVAEVGGFSLVWVGAVEGRRVVPLDRCGPESGYLEEIEIEIDGELGAGPTGTCIRENRTVVNDNFETNLVAKPWQEAARRRGFRASAAFPLRRAGIVAGALTLYSGETGGFDADQVALLEALSADVSYALDVLDAEEQRARTEKELARAKQEWERTFDSVPDMIAILDDRHRIVRVNAAMADRLGVRPDECAGVSCFEAVHGLSEPPAFCPHSRTMEDCLQHVVEVHEDKLGGDFEVTTTPVRDELGGSIGTVHVVHDITNRKRGEKEREIAVQFLSIVNRSTTREELVRDTLTFFRKETGCVAVGIRLKEGDDYPYFEATGFPEEFVLSETSLCARDESGHVVRDDAGSPLMECMCGNVIQGRFDPSKPFFTGSGSFWTNNTTELLATTSDEDRQARTRNRCNGEGYESVALIALRIGRQPLGLLQFNDSRKDRFSAEGIALIERLAGYLAVALAKVEAEEALKRAHDSLELRVRERTEELRETYGKLLEEAREREQVEAQLRQAQKMDALGTLTGGIAHDFNNILAAIIGFTDMVRGHLPEDSRDARSLGRVMDAGLRARELIKQMLAFSRKGDLEKKPLLVGSVVKETMKLLRASIPTTVNIRVKVEKDSGKILGDPIQLQQVLMNLCTNAAYAMREKGGTLDVGLGDFVVAERNQDAVEPGSYVRLMVRDTGEGIPETEIDKIFDPFFTTKKRGEGTGLGLSVVHGIVHQFDGRIIVESEVGKGSTFCVYFPKIAEGTPTASAEEEAIPTGCERVLFVDDEQLLAEMGQDLLEELGYEVVSHTGSRAALAQFKLDPSKFDVIITDQTMPELTGIELAREAIAISPATPVILCTGFSYQVDSDMALQAGIRAFVMKPLTKREIAKVVRQVLDR